MVLYNTVQSFLKIRGLRAWTRACCAEICDSQRGANVSALPGCQVCARPAAAGILLAFTRSFSEQLLFQTAVWMITHENISRKWETAASAEPESRRRCCMNVTCTYVLETQILSSFIHAKGIIHAPFCRHLFPLMCSYIFMRVLFSEDILRNVSKNKSVPQKTNVNFSQDTREEIAAVC